MRSLAREEKLGLGRVRPCLRSCLAGSRRGKDSAGADGLRADDLRHGAGLGPRPRRKIGPRALPRQCRDRQGGQHLHERQCRRLRLLARRQGDSQLPRRQVLRYPRHEDPRGSGWRVHLRRPQRQRRGDQVQRANRRDRPEAAVSRRVGTQAEEIQSHGDHRRAQRRHLPVRRLREQSHFQVRQDRQVPDALRDQGERSQAIQHRPRHDARHALRPAAPA